MATVAWVLDEPTFLGGLTPGVSGAVDQLPKGVIVVKWPDLTSGDVGAPFTCPSQTEKHVACGGTFGAGQVQMEVNDVASGAARYSIAKDSQGNPMVFAISDGNPVTKTMKPVEMQVRPNCVAGDGTTDLTVRMLIRP